MVCVYVGIATDARRLEKADRVVEASSGCTSQEERRGHCLEGAPHT